MYNEIKNILIFKTDIATAEARHCAGKILDAHMLIHHWNVDLDDEDCVLRIVSAELTPQDVISTINNCGFFCEELAG
ncbi:hypothetical protein KXQ82_03210 [Mucilaginibacter sp. HMF5004]|uniref:hypothetical protein n=1 Tax=Mucilaginibacter rivuli TaxID=2857527 RepID=UPI001C5F01BE|nr:hypothetical protein [Mucilaginibacter rivuli]MBW4888702.1 hypothetical protein [Mucilaginibacter rivuli]